MVKTYNKRQLKLNKLCLICLTAILLCTFLLSFVCCEYVYADNPQTTYSNVLDDLKKDTSFNSENYPAVETDFSLNVIHVAESSTKELLLYVYHPAACFVATSINANLTDETNAFAIYHLDLQSQEGVFYKYKVSDFTVSEETTRVYTIISIFRDWVKEADCPKDENGEYIEPLDENKITEVSYAVGKKYTFTADTVSCVDIEYINVTSKYVGFCRYMDGPHFFPCNYDCCDCHFVAFSTDRRIDKLLSADVYYTSQYAMTTTVTPQPSKMFGQKLEKVANLSYTDKSGYYAGGLFDYAYSWDKIQTVDEFLASETNTTVYSCGIFDVFVQNKLSDTAVEALKGKQWVLRFAETDYSKSSTPAGYTEYFDIVGDVSLLRLQYETNSHVYDFGVVDNKQTGSDEPVNEPTITPHMPDWLVKLLTALFWIAVILLCIPFLPFIIKLVWWILKYTVLAIWYIVKYLAVGIYWLFAWPFYIHKK